jgi:hypothetical protein
VRLSEARCALGRRVTYTPEGTDEPVSGKILRCDGSHVYIIPPSGGAIAMDPADLEFQ